MVRDEVIPLFASPLMVCSYIRDYTKELKWIKKQKYYKHKRNDQSVDHIILDNPELKKIRTFVETKLNKFVTEILRSTNTFVITQSWVNISGLGQSHHRHTHPNSIVSGVFYINSKKELPPIEFRKNTEPVIQLSTKDYGPFNNESLMFPAQSGELLIFPSTMIHSVPVNKYDEKRISLSFNTWVKGDLGDASRLTSLPFDRLI